MLAPLPLRKLFYAVIMLKSKILPLKTDHLTNTKKTLPAASFYDLQAIDEAGNAIPFSKFKGKKVIIVNTASTCGYAPQFFELEIMKNQFKNNVVVIGFPSNDFKQERAENVSITQFCLNNYGVTFPLMQKGNVAKKNQQQVYQWLSNAANNGWCNHAPTWNFCKYVIDEKGILAHYFSQYVSPINDEFIAAVKN